MSRSSSSSQANQTSNVTDQRTAASDQAIAVGAGATLIQDTVSDEIAVAALEEMGKTARDVTARGTDAAVELNDRGLDFGEAVVEAAAAGLGKQLDTVRASNETNAKLAETLATVAIENLEANKRDPESDAMVKIGTGIAVAAAVVGVAYVLSR